MALGNPAVAGNAPDKSTAESYVNRCSEDLRTEYAMALYTADLFGIAVILSGQLAASLRNSSPAVDHYASALLGGACVFVTMVILARYRLIPSQEMMNWQADRQADMLVEIEAGARPREAQSSSWTGSRDEREHRRCSFTSAPSSN